MNFESQPQPKKPMISNKSAAIGLAMAGLIPNLETSATENPEALKINPSETVESVMDSSSREDHKDAYVVTKTDFETGGEKDKEKKESGTLNLESYEKYLDAGFDMGKADISPEKRQELKEELKTFLESLPQELKGMINRGEVEIVVTGTTSFHAIAKTGVNTGKRGLVYENYTLGTYRSNELRTSVVDPAIEEVEGIDNQVKVVEYTPEGGVSLKEDALEQGRESFVFLRLVPEEKTDSMNEEAKKSLERTLSLNDLSDAAYVIIDRSHSMKAEAKLVEQEVVGLNNKYKKGIKIINLKAGEMNSNEDHLGTFHEVKEDIENSAIPEGTKSIHIYTDEDQNEAPQNAKESFQEIIDFAHQNNMEIILHRYAKGDTGKRIDKVLEADDLLGGEIIK